MVEYHLKILGQDDNTERLIDLKNGFSIGTAGTNDLCLKTQGMEPKHCTFRLHNEILSVYNHDTGGQTSIDNFPLKAGKSYIVDQGDTIIIGDMRFKIYKNLGAMKDENISLEKAAHAAVVDLHSDDEIDDVELEMDDDIELDDVELEMDDSDEDLLAQPSSKPANAVDEALEEYGDDMFEIDPTQMTKISDELPMQEMTYKRPESPVSMAQSNQEQLDDDGDLDIEIDDDMDLEMDLSDDDDLHDIVNDVASAAPKRPQNAVDESLDDYDNDLFDNVDPTRMDKLPDEFRPSKPNPPTTFDSIEDDDSYADADPTRMAVMPSKAATVEEEDDDDILNSFSASANPFEELDNEIAFQDAAPTTMAQIPDELRKKKPELKEPTDYKPFAGMDDDMQNEEEEDDLFANVDPTRMDNLPDEFRPVNRSLPSEAPLQASMSTLEDDLDDDFENAEPTMMAKIPDILNQSEASNNSQENSTADLISEEDLLTEDDLEDDASQELPDITDEIEIPAELNEPEKKEPTNTSSKVTQLGAGVELPISEGSSEDVFKQFEFVDDASGLLGSKDVERIKKEAIDKMATEMSGINILPIDDLADDGEEEVDFSFGDEGAGLNKIFTPDNPPPAQAKPVPKVEEDQEPKTKSFVKDFEMKTTLASRELNDEDTEDFDGGSGSYNTGVIDLGQEKTKILDTRMEKGEDLFPGEDQTMEKIGVAPLPPVSEFRPNKSTDLNEPLSVEEALLSAKQVDPDEEPSKKKGLFNKLKGVFGKKKKDDDDDEDDDWEDDDDLDDEDDDDIDDEDDDEDDEGFGMESSLTGVTDMIVNFLQQQKDDAKNKTDAGITPPAQENKKENKQEAKNDKKKPDLKLVKNEDDFASQTMIQKAQAQGMGLDLSEDDLDLDESKDFVIEESIDTGNDNSVTNINIGELNEKLKALEEEGKEVQKKGFFKGLFGKKDKVVNFSDDEELEFDEDDGEDDFANNKKDVKAKTKGSEKDEDFSIDVPDNLKDGPEFEDEATDPGIDNEPTDPGMVLNEEVEEEEEDKKQDLKAAPSLIKGAKKGKRKSKFRHGPFPWVFGRAYAFICSVAITKLTYDIVFGFLGYTEKYLDIVQKVFTPSEQYLKMYQEYLLLGINTIPKYVKEVKPYIAMVEWEKYLSKISDFDFFKYVLLFIVIESASALLLGTTIPKFFMGIKSTDSYPKSAMKSIFMTIFGVITIPALIFDLPILFRMSSIKEILTRTELYYRSKVQMIVAPLLILPVLFVLWYLSPFANLELKTLPLIENSSSINLKDVEEEGLTAFSSETLALKGNYTKNDKFAYLPIFEKNDVHTITFVDSFLKETASMTVRKVLDTKDMTTELMQKYPAMEYIYETGMDYPNFMKFVDVSLQMSLNNPISLIEPLKDKNPFTNAYIYLQQYIIQEFEILNPVLATKQNFGSNKNVYTFQMPKIGANNIDSFLVVDMLDIREFKVSYEGKENKAKNRLIRNFLGAKSTMVHVDNDLSAFNAFNAFDMVMRFRSSQKVPLDLKESSKAFYFNKAKEVVFEENELLKKPLIKSLKSLLSELNSIDNSEAKELSSELDKTLQALDKLNKDYFSRQSSSSNWKKPTQSVKKSSTKEQKERNKKTSSSKRRR